MLKQWMREITGKQRKEDTAKIQEQGQVLRDQFRRLTEEIQTTIDQKRQQHD